ncbi:MAG: TetR/AcrR family transcriptional regulator [Corynebacterium sp.]|nr:TetR/AcrR family transcriptional regulator [Corynebacterium sp.]
MAGLRESKKAATREAIARSAASLSLQKGITEVTVAEISEMANVSARTFHNYFASREEAIGWFLELEFTRIREAFEEAITDELSLFPTILSFVSKYVDESNPNSLDSFYAFQRLADQLNSLVPGTTESLLFKIFAGQIEGLEGVHKVLTPFQEYAIINLIVETGTIITHWRINHDSSQEPVELFMSLINGLHNGLNELDKTQQG